ncbi:conserved domain protein [Prevotella denticola CRIS 18C-A]|uniref:Conserved domain protein n=1 Tax=Prevotella denticola CRIS 18C-A TaxID=944557 RepID=F0H9A0_9BACT|nr:conserved domain protein [Prevotella denticola CRIS 18C-A]
MQPGTFSNGGRSRLIDSILRAAQNWEYSRPTSVLSISAGSISEAGLTTLKKVNYQDKNRRISTLFI